MRRPTEANVLYEPSRDGKNKGRGYGTPLVQPGLSPLAPLPLMLMGVPPLTALLARIKAHGALVDAAPVLP